MQQIPIYYVVSLNKPDYIPTAKKLSGQTKSAYIIFLHLHGGMHITIERYTCISMTEQLAESFGIETICNTNSRIGMAKKMKGSTPQLTIFQNSLEAILHRSWFCWFFSS